MLYFYITTSLYPKIDTYYYMQCYYILSYADEFVRKAIFNPYKEILRLITKAINLDKVNNCNYYYIRGIAYLNLGEFDKALVDLFYSNELFKREKDPTIRMKNNRVLHIGYFCIAKCYLMKKNFILFNKYLSIALNCKCEDCTNEVHLRAELKRLKVQIITQWKSKIFQKILKKW